MIKNIFWKVDMPDKTVRKSLNIDMKYGNYLLSDLQTGGKIFCGLA